MLDEMTQTNIPRLFCIFYLPRINLLYCTIFPFLENCEVMMMRIMMELEHVASSYTSVNINFIYFSLKFICGLHEQTFYASSGKLIEYMISHKLHICKFLDLCAQQGCDLLNDLSLKMIYCINHNYNL